MATRRSGTEPVTARSALSLRTWLASFGVVTGAIATFWLAAAARGSSGSDRTMFALLALVALLSVLVAVVDLMVLARRQRGTRPGG
jgi:hypothetical protein